MMCFALAFPFRAFRVSVGPTPHWIFARALRVRSTKMKINPGEEGWGGHSGTELEQGASSSSPDGDTSGDRKSWKVMGSRLP